MKKKVLAFIGAALCGLALIGALTPDASRSYFLLSLLLSGFAVIAVGGFMKED